MLFRGMDMHYYSLIDSKVTLLHSFIFTLLTVLLDQPFVYMCSTEPPMLTAICY